MVLDLDCEERIKLESQRVNPRPEGARRHETAKYPCRLNDSKKKRERERNWRSRKKQGQPFFCVWLPVSLVDGPKRGGPSA